MKKSDSDGMDGMTAITLLNRPIRAPQWMKTLPESHRFNALHCLISYATLQYIRFFHDPDHPYSSHQWRGNTKELLKLPDLEAVDALYEMADMFPYSWASDEHPNWRFATDMLDVVDWKQVLSKLRKEAEGED